MNLFLFRHSCFHYKHIQCQKKNIRIQQIHDHSMIMKKKQNDDSDLNLFGIYLEIGQGENE